MAIIFQVDLLGWRSAPDHYTAAYIKPWLEALVQSNMVYLRENPQTPSILDPVAGIRYRRERDSQGNPTEIWRDIPRILRDRHGDCEDLACALVAELRVKRRLPAKVILKASPIRPGGRLFHIIAGVGRERIDPSKMLGMNGEG